MESTVTNEKLNAKIEAIKAAAAVELKLQIEQATISFNLTNARKELKEILAENDNKHKAAQDNLIKEFEAIYGKNSFEPKQLKEFGYSLSPFDKAQYVKTLKDASGKLKYTRDGENIIGTKGEPVNSTIVYKDENGKKQTLSVASLKKYM